MVRFGIEEEFMLLDPWRLSPVARAESLREELAQDPVLGDYVHHEFLASQIEYSSPICTRLDEALSHLGGFRTALGSLSSRFDALAAGTGMPFDTGIDPPLTPDARYARVRSDIRAMVNDHQINAVHVHVEVADRDAGIRALNGVRPWLPVLLALGANSPFWKGADTGFGSWRCLVLRRWGVAGVPPYFRDADDYARRTQRLVRSGAILDLPTIAWGARLSERYPTIEIRVFDAQLRAQDTVLLAALSRALVATVTATRPTMSVPDHPGELIDAALWLATRDGTSNGVFDALSGDIVPAREAIAGLMTFIGDALDESGDRDEVDRQLQRMLTEGTGAERQRAAHRSGGQPSLAALFSMTQESEAQRTA
ncbi:MAG: YbdK family carboxylate-amine ligase [Microterricola sp.]